MHGGSQSIGVVPDRPALSFLDHLCCPVSVSLTSIARQLNHSDRRGVESAFSVYASFSTSSTPPIVQSQERQGPILTTLETTL